MDHAILNWYLHRHDLGAALPFYGTLIPSKGVSLSNIANMPGPYARMPRATEQEENPRDGDLQHAVSRRSVTMDAPQ